MIKVIGRCNKCIHSNFKYYNNSFFLLLIKRIMSFASTSLSLLDIQNALGGTNPISFNEYYNNAVPGYGIGVVGVPSINNPIDIGTFTGKTIPTTVTLSNSGEALTDYAINFTLNYKSSYGSTFQDLRFYNEATNTVLSHWYESVTNGTSVDVWLKIPSFTNGTRIKVSTGNSASSGTPSSVFPLYEDFSSFDTTNKWTVSGSYSASTNNFQFTNTTFTYAITKSNYPMDMVLETSLSSGSANAIPEFILRGNTTNNTGIKSRVDCRAPTGQAGVGSYLNNPFASWSVLYFPNNYSFPSNGTLQKIQFSTSSSNYAFSHNNTLATTYTNNNSTLMNTEGAIGVANHNGLPVTFSWIRAYPSTSNVISVSIT